MGVENRSKINKTKFIYKNSRRLNGVFSYVQYAQNNRGGMGRGLAGFGPARPYITPAFYTLSPTKCFVSQITQTEYPITVLPRVTKLCTLYAIIQIQKINQLQISLSSLLSITLGEQTDVPHPLPSRLVSLAGRHFFHIGSNSKLATHTIC